MQRVTNINMMEVDELFTSNVVVLHRRTLQLLFLLGPATVEKSSSLSTDAYQTNIHFSNKHVFCVNKDYNTK